MNISDAQYQYGVEKVRKLSERWGISTRKTAEILIDISFINEEWRWVNMDNFLHLYIYNPKN